MMHQDQLWTPAAEAIHISCIYEHGRGWRVVVGERRSGESWSDRVGRVYECLTSGELLDVATCDLAHVLGL